MHVTALGGNKAAASYAAKEQQIQAVVMAALAIPLEDAEDYEAGFAKLGEMLPDLIEDAPEHVEEMQRTARIAGLFAEFRRQLEEVDN